MEKKAGFSLVELMVVIGIFALVGGFGLNFINNFGARQDLATVKDELVSALRLARSYAISQQQVAGFGGEMRYVSLEVDQTGVRIYPDTSSATPYSVRTYSSEGVSMTKSNGNDTIRFLAFEGKMVGTTGAVLGAGESVTITLTSLANGSTMTVLVDGLGVVDE